MEFEASYDLFSKIVTIGLVILFFGIITAAALWNWDYAGFGASALLGLIILFTYLFGTQKYVVTESELIIKQRITEKRIPLDDIANLQVNPSLEGMTRTFGNGGLFGYFGKYYSRELGSMKLYATQTDSRVLITTKTGEKLLISPDDAYRLAEEIENQKFLSRRQKRHPHKNQFLAPPSITSYASNMESSSSEKVLREYRTGNED